MKKFKTSLWILLAIVCMAILTLPVILNKETETLNPENRKEAPGDFINLPNGITHYEAFGHDTAQTVLLVSGLSVPYYIWDPTFEFLKRNGFHVIRYDLFGRGYSDRPDVVYNSELFTQQIADLLAALKIDKPVDIFGLSMGGPIVAEFTHKFPEKVRKLILIGPVNEPANTSVLKVPVLGNFLIDLFFANRQSGDFFKPEEHADWPQKFRPQMKYKGFKRAIRSTLINYMNEDKLPAYIQLGKLDKEILLIWGENDKTTPFEGNLRIREVVKSDFLSVKESGHLPHMEHPQPVHSKIIHFLNK
jgi:pimeloyl-ACP methyl ester carboxylesterase